MTSLTIMIWACSMISILLAIIHVFYSIRKRCNSNILSMRKITRHQMISRHLLILLVIDIVNKTTNVDGILERSLHSMYICCVSSRESSHISHTSFSIILCRYIILAVIILFALKIFASKSGIVQLLGILA